MNIIAISISALGMVTSISLVSWFLLCDYFRSKSDYYKELAKTEQCKQQREMTEYSDQMLKFIRDFIADAAVLKFKSYQDNVLLEKVTRENLSRFVSQVIQDIRIALRENQIKIEYLIYDQAYIDQYIIDTAMIMIKKIFEDSLEDAEDNLNFEQ